MPEPTGLSIPAVSAAINIGKTLHDLVVATKNAELINAVADLNLNLADAKNEIATLRTENRRLQDALDTKARIIYDEKRNVIIKSPQQHENPGPHCRVCYETRRALVGLVEADPDWQMIRQAKWECPSCKTAFK